MSNEVYLVAAARTPVGSFMGQLSDISAPKLGAHTISQALSRSGFKPDQVEEVVFGEVLTAGVGQAPARQAAIYAGLPTSVPCMTVNKVCGSGLKAVMLASDSIRLNRASVVVAGGQENMSLAPHLLEKSRAGFRMGPQAMSDSMIKDGLWDPYNQFHMGTAAELCMKEHRVTREAQDGFAIGSYKKAQHAQNAGWLKDEIAPFEVAARSGTTLVAIDEEPLKARFEKMPELKPAFDSNGTITAANASKINDGAAALIVTSAEAMKKASAKPLARIKAHATFAHDPKWFTTAPLGAIDKALKEAGLKASDIDLWEINEAFSVVTMVAQKELSLAADRVNVHGGAIAFGHPIGASGARILTTLLYALQTHNKRYGLATLCIGGGEAVALIVERV